MYLCPITGLQNLVITSNIDNLDLAKYVLGGRIHLRIYISSGVRVGSSTAATPAIYSSRTITGPSQVYIKNDGDIWGCNGAGGYCEDGTHPAIAGWVGGSAISLNSKLEIDNTNGNIWAGGGGGGGGGWLGGGGGGYPGGVGGPSPGSYYGETKQYGVALGGLGYATNDGGDCLGPGLAGEAGESGAAGGAAGYSVDASGNSITWLGGNNVDQVRGSTN